MEFKAFLPTAVLPWTVLCPPLPAAFSFPTAAEAHRGQLCPWHAVLLQSSWPSSRLRALAPGSLVLHCHLRFRPFASHHQVPPKSHLLALPQLYQDTEHFPILTGALKMLGWLAQARMPQPCLSSHPLHTHLPCHWLQSSRIFAASLCRVSFMSAPKVLKISATVSLAPKTLLRPHASSTTLFFKVFHFFYPGDQMYLL